MDAPESGIFAHRNFVEVVYVSKQERLIYLLERDLLTGIRYKMISRIDDALRIHPAALCTVAVSLGAEIIDEPHNVRIFLSVNPCAPFCNSTIRCALIVLASASVC